MRHSYRLCGLAGFLCGAGAAVALSPLPAGWLAALALASAGVLLALTMVTKLVTGEEKLVCYHHQIAVFTAVASLARLCGEPVLASLDAAALGLAVFLSFGRVGCLAVGCCYGRPCRHGIRYSREHVAEGFPAKLEGIPLIPVQLFEAVASLGLACAAGALMWAGAAPGSAFLVWCCGYATARFFLEFLRGDAARPVWCGFSEAQWTSFAVLAACSRLTLIDR